MIFDELFTDRVCVSVWDIFPRKEERFRLPPRGRARACARVLRAPYLLTDSSKMRNKKKALRAAVLEAIVCEDMAAGSTLHTADINGHISAQS